MFRHFCVNEHDDSVKAFGIGVIQGYGVKSGIVVVFKVFTNFVAESVVNAKLVLGQDEICHTRDDLVIG